MGPLYSDVARGRVGVASAGRGALTGGEFWARLWGGGGPKMGVVSGEGQILGRGFLGAGTRLKEGDNTAGGWGRNNTC